MSVFGKKLKICREEKKISQSKLAKLIGVHHSIIGRYEREETKPTIDVVTNLAKALNTTVGYLLGENEELNLFKDPIMLNRFKEIQNLSEDDKHCILYAIDNLLASAKTRQAYK